MQIIKKESVVKCFDHPSELELTDRELLNKAREAMEQAYAPYSEFLVGCALLLANGKIVTGNNQENMAYPSGLCAERVAIFYAGANYPDVPVMTMAITAKARNFKLNDPIMSCGACLQSISEYEKRFGQPIRTLLQAEEGPVWLAEEGTHTFLPFQFDVQELKK